MWSYLIKFKTISSHPPNFLQKKFDSRISWIILTNIQWCVITICCRPLCDDKVKQNLLWPAIPQWKNLLPEFVGSISITCSNVTEVAQWATPSCSRPQPATNRALETVDSIGWPLPPTVHRVMPPERHWHTILKSVLLSSLTGKSKKTVYFIDLVRTVWTRRFYR